ncbi:transforming growth factor beta regulator 1 [Dissophora globulifera]|uniref:Transforming growth factor beta regulator 1 n=1 Tax=Dissophora globulifera TaxID=979702 RepID=A0A9P6RYU2_9FUNG|nr:transforming growth factor beta regulator 1 [Dissophora globulifera]
MKDEPLSFKDKYLRLRERFDRVSTTQRQYTTDLQAARLKARKLKEENDHLLDLLSEMQRMNGSGPSSDSDTSVDDMSDYDDEDEDELREEGHDIASGHGERMAQDCMNIAGASDSINNGVANGGQINQSNSNNRQGSNSISGQGIRTGPIKRADRGRPRAVVPLPTNPDGSLNYPIVVGKGTNEVIIENMGRIVWQGRGYHNHRYIFPVGFRSKKQYTSLSDTSKKTYFINEILDGGEQPIFQITLEDMPEKVFRHSSSSGAWELALKGLMELGYNAKTHASGPDMYGLTNLGVIKYIQEMPNAHRCRRYMPLKWIIEEDGPNSPQPQGDSAESKSPGRKKKINNSLYASNHEVLLETMEEVSGPRSTSGSRPYTPRKYTKRKTLQDRADEISSPALAAPTVQVSESESGVEAMDDVEQDIDQTMETPMGTPLGTPVATTLSMTPATPRSLGGQDAMYLSMGQAQEVMQDKKPLDPYDHAYGQSLMEP